MSDPLYELLVPHLSSSTDASSLPPPAASDAVTSRYLARLPKLDLAAIQTTEPQSLAQSSHSTLLALQALSSRSAKSIIASTDHLESLSKHLPAIERCGRDIRSGVATLDSQAVAFSTKYSRSGDNASDIIERRKRALLLARNVDRVGDILELPTLLASAVNSAAAGASAAASGAGGSSSTAATSATYNAALDLHGHVKRLAMLHPESELIGQISKDAAEAMREMTTSLIQTLRGTNLKLAGGMRTIGWLRRVAPELNASASRDSTTRGGSVSISAHDEEGAFGALFLVCRLANLLTTLEALEPMKVLADQETAKRNEGTKTTKGEGGGHQTERYLKRYVELFREQSFGIVSMFRSIFPTEDDVGVGDLGLNLDKMGLGKNGAGASKTNAESLPSALATFPLHLVEHVLLPTLREYLSNVSDKSARESLLTQVLYCAGSLGRLGGDFSILLSGLYDDEEDDGEDDTRLLEWVDIVKKHRVQAARLESLATSGSSRVRSAA